MITARELVEWEAITNARTPGEWRQGAVEKYNVFCSADDPDVLAPGLGRVLLGMNTHFPYEADAAFIALASIAMSRLIRQAKIATDVVYARCSGQEFDLIEKLTTLDELTERHARAAAELETYRTKGAGPWEKRAADRLADEVNVLVRRKIIDARSPAADALLDYRDPPYTEHSDRMAELERSLEDARAAIVTLVTIGDLMRRGIAKGQAAFDNRRDRLSVAGGANDGRVQKKDLELVEPRG